MTYLLSSDGTPVVTYRGEHGEGSWLETRRGSLSFGSAMTANTYAAEPNDLNDTPIAPRVQRVHLLMARPFHGSEDPFFDLSEYKKHFGEEEAIRLALKFAGYVTNTNNWEEILQESGRDVTLSEYLMENPSGVDLLYFELYALLDDQEEVARLVQKGFDGAWCGGSGLNSAEIEYRVFEKIQVVPTCAGLDEFQARAEAYQAIRDGNGLREVVKLHSIQQRQPEPWRGRLIADMLETRVMRDVRAALELLPSEGLSTLPFVFPEVKTTRAAINTRDRQAEINPFQFAP